MTDPLRARLAALVERACRSLTGRIVTVTAGDIRRGERWSPYACPIALAVQRLPGVARRFRCVGYYELCVTSPKHRHAEYGLPKTVQQFIARFDDGKRVKPFRFRIGRETK
jgi:hypothetical protein